MARKEGLKGSGSSYSNEKSGCGNACTSVYKAYFGVRKLPKNLKEEGFISTIGWFLPIKYGAILHISFGCVLSVRVRTIYLSSLHFITADR